MRCPVCAWIVSKDGCPCGATAGQLGPIKVPVGTRVMARPGRGPSMSMVWMTGAVAAHLGHLHQVETRNGLYWCEIDDLLPDSPGRTESLDDGDRCWAHWLDGRWYTGTIDGCEGPLRHVTFDDGDAMWLEALQTVPLAVEPSAPVEGTIVIAKHWDGEYRPARVEDQDGSRYKVQFQDGDEGWVPGDDLYTFPPNPFTE